jgi:hypothetical protein
VKSKDPYQRAPPTAPQGVCIDAAFPTSRIDGIAAALKALGKRLDMRTV